MVSVKDIAARCHVSVATVSKALNGYSDISESKRKLIKDTAQEMGYFPNAAAIALKTNRSYNIGILFEDAAGNGFTNEYYAQLLQAIKQEAESRGYDITFIYNKIGGRQVTYLEHCRYRGVDGVVMVCIDYNLPGVAELIKSELPVVTIDHVFDNAMSVSSDNGRGISELVKYVYDMGHRKIAFIYGDETSVTRDRLTGFYRTIDELGVVVPDEYVLQSSYRNPDKSKDCTAKLLDLKDPPTCILYPDDFAAIGGINEIKARGLRIPEDISVVGYDGISYSKVMEPSLTTVEQDTSKLGKTAAANLIRLIEKPKTTSLSREIIQGHVLIGKSVSRLKF
ncbi:MAG: LacI family transcriptional regulator [Lachnospiraceae bacterium]|nr:LacI family transcriptional regulator [Lachnospiraceae bacterium]